MGLLVNSRPAPTSSVIWTPNPGKQEEALTRPEKEILYGGARGGGKSEAGRAWFLKWVHLSYFRGLVIRLQSEDLKEWCEKANTLYSKLGAVMTGRPPQFKFPSGALIWTGHLADESSYMKYQGWEIHKLLIEELTQIPTEERYDKLLGSLRSGYEDIETQAFLTTNPGGPGNDWVQKRFITCTDYRGRAAVPMKPTLLDPAGLQSRIFIPATVDDNPTLFKTDPGYLAYLDSLPENLRKAWRYGDWDAFKGQYFPEFRAARKLADPPEPAEALHVIKPVELKPWLHRWAAWDWAYSHSSVVHWGCQGEDGRVHVYRELHCNEKGDRTRRYGAEEMGAMVAEASIPDIEGMPDKHLTIHLSPDAFWKRDAVNTIAKQIENGMKKVLGPDAVFLVEQTVEERALGSEQGYLSLEKRREAQKSRTKITIEPANNDRLGGWMYVHEMLRWWPIKTYSETEPDEQVVRAILRMPDASRRYVEYMSQFTMSGGEVLPRVLIHSCCSELPRGLVRARHNEKNPEDVLKEDGDDAIESFRYLLMAYKKVEATMPKSEYVSSKVESRLRSFGDVSTQGRVMMSRVAEKEYDTLNSGAKWLSVKRRAA
jgi:hypothetical protein